MIYPYPRLSSLGIIFCFLIPLSACVQGAEKQNPAVITDTVPKKDLSIHGYFSDQELLRTDSSQLKSFFLKYPLLKNYKSDIYKFYGYRNFHYAWFNQNRLVEQASNLYNHLNNLELEGIQTPVPYKDILDSLFNDPSPEKGPDPDLEILLSAEYFFYADRVWNGIPEKKTAKLEWFLPRKKLNLPFMMDSLLKDNSDSIFSANFSILQYKLLKAQLRKYRHLDSAGTWKSLNANARVFKKYDSSEIIRDIRHRLYLLGDLDNDSRSNLFDDNLETAVKSFQDRNGLIPDGIINAAFFHEINITPQENIRKLIVNMERARWIPTNLSKHFIIINIPAFTLTVYDGDTISFKMKVVVGKEVHKTMIFNGDIKYIVFSPYWNVPASIMRKEILPAIKRHPDYLKKNNMEWYGNIIRQKPGPSNSLGLIKFLFPNSYNMYLHDTPAKNLFDAQTRAFSHGCIRVAEARKLAVYLLKDDPQWNEEKIDEAMNAGKEKYVVLRNPVPVFIGYLTAWVDNKGRLNFRKDIYKRDKELQEMLIQK